jgi:hypothetical protein
MVRSLWIGLGVTVLAVTGLAWGQVLPPGTTPATPKEHTLTVQETDKPPLKCKIIKTWQVPDGRKALQVQALSTGEMITIVQPAPGAAEPGKLAATKIYHWGGESKPPAGAPEAPKDAMASAPVAPAAPAVPVAPVAQPGSVVEAPKASSAPKTNAEVAKAPVPGHQSPSAVVPERHETMPAKDAATTTITKRPSITETKPATPGKVWPPAFQPEIVEDKPSAPTVAANPMPTPTPPITQPKDVAMKKTEPMTAPTMPATPAPIKNSDTKKTVVAKDPLPATTTQPKDVAMKKTEPTTPALPSAIKDNDTKKTVVAKDPPPAATTQPKDVVVKKTEPAASPTTPALPTPIKDNDTKKTVAAKDPPAPPPVTTPAKPVVTEIVRNDVPKPPALSGTTVVPHVTTTPPAMPTIIQGPEAKSQTEAHMPVVISGHDDGSTTVVHVPSVVVTPGVEPVGPVTPTVPKKVNSEQPKQGPTLVQNPAPVAQPTPKVVSSPEPPKPSDWRQSWGRVETQPPAQPKPEATRTVVKTDTPRKLDLPHADTTKTDPLQTPDRYVKVPTPGASTVKPPPASDSPKVLQMTKNTTQPEGSGLKPPAMAMPDVTPPAKSADSGPDVPLGMGSVAAAKTAEPAVVAPPAGKPQPAPAANDWDGGNAFTPAQPLPTTPSPGKPAPPPANLAQANLTMPSQPPAPPLPPPPGVMPIPMDRAVPSGMANAFTNGGSTRPIPPDFGQPDQPGNAFSPPYPNVGPPPSMQQAPPITNRGSSQLAMVDRRQPTLPAQAPMQMDQLSSASNTPQLLAVLRDSLYPSQREMAVESLAGQRGAQAQPQIVQALLSAAKNDMAATVRASCVRAIAQLQINTVPAVTVVQSLKNDPDPRVRREVEQALPALTGGQPLSLDPAVRPVSGH